MLVMERGQMAMSLGEFIQKRRRDLGLTQTDLADRLEWTDAGRVSRVEQGQAFRRFPPPEEVHELAVALETTPEAILRAVGYLRDDTPDRTPEQVFTMLADELRDTPDLNPEVRDTGIALLTHLKRLQEGSRGPAGE